MPSLLFLTQRIPYPPIKGEKIRPLQILRHLRRSFEIYLGTIIDDPDDWRHVKTVRSLCKAAYFAPLNRKVAKISCVSGLLTGEPLSVRFFYDRGLRRWIDETLNRVRPDVVFVCSGNMAPYVLDHRHRGAVRIVDLADVDSEKWHAYSEKTKGLMHQVYRREASLMLDLERRIAAESDATTFVTEAEAACFRRLAPESAERVHGISSGVDYDYFDPAVPHPTIYDPRDATFVFTGTMDYPPNVDAVSWFAREILPQIRHRMPEARFYIVGSSPSPEVMKLGNQDGVIVTGRVPDVRPYLAHATACVAPLRIARGIQNKVLEAMAMGRATIVTPDALEGIDALPGRDVVVATDSGEFSDIAVELARDSERAARIGAAARQLVEQRYSWAAQMRAFDALLSAVRLGDADVAGARNRDRERDR